MTDQCYDEPEEGRTPEPVPYIVGAWTETWTTGEQMKVYRNASAKLELAKKALHNIADILRSDGTQLERVNNSLKVIYYTLLEIEDE